MGSRQWLRDIVALHARSPAEREELRHLPASVRGYLIVSCFIDLYALTRLPLRDAPAVAALSALYALAMLVPPIPSPLGAVRIPRLALTATIALLWPPLAAFIAVACGVLLGVFAFRLYEPWRAIMNTVNWAYPAALASIVGHLVMAALPDPLVGLMAAGVTVVVVYWAANFAALSLSHHLTTGEPFWRYWWQCVSENPLGRILSAPLPIFLAAVALGLVSRAWTLLLLTGLAALTIPSARAQLDLYYASLRTTSDVVGALLLGLERIVPGASAHAERVARLVGETGRRLRLSTRAVEVWRQAGLLHDIGLLDAQSRTGAQELHAQMGARILASHPDPFVADIVRAHHLPCARGPAAGAWIAALGGRVLAAAERYDELRHGTPVAPGFATHDATARALRLLVGTQLDPDATNVVVEAAAGLEQTPDGARGARAARANGAVQFRRRARGARERTPGAESGVGRAPERPGIPVGVILALASAACFPWHRAATVTLEGATLLATTAGTIAWLAAHPLRIQPHDDLALVAVPFLVALGVGQPLFALGGGLLGLAIGSIFQSRTWTPAAMAEAIALAGAAAAAMLIQLPATPFDLGGLLVAACAYATIRSVVVAGRIARGEQMAWRRALVLAGSTTAVSLVAPVLMAVGAVVIERAWLPTASPLALSTLPLLAGTVVLQVFQPYSQRGREEHRGLAITVVFADAMDVKDPSTGIHSHAVAQLSRRIARTAGVTEELAHQVFLTGLLHDIGKIGIPDAILQKPGSLTVDEWRVMQAHVVDSGAMVQRISGLAAIAPLVRASHESYDGAGYPDHLRGEGIPLAARIVAIADTYHALTNDRPYRKRRDTDAALAELDRCAGTQFDPRLVRAFRRTIVGTRRLGSVRQAPQASA